MADRKEKAKSVTSRFHKESDLQHHMSTFVIIIVIKGYEENQK